MENRFLLIAHRETDKIWQLMEKGFELGYEELKLELDFITFVDFIYLSQIV